MALTLGGIALAVLGRPTTPGQTAAVTRSRARGVLVALLATLCQAGGLILSKIGAPHLDAFAGTEVRVLVGVVAFGLILLATGGGRGIVLAMKDGKAVASLVAGSFFGPFLGVSLSLLAIQGASTGVASSIMSLTPVLIIIPSVIVFREKVTLVEILGALVAVAGTVLLFI
jgi:drug/metabolite transporter (DMT)-like permease